MDRMQSVQALIGAAPALSDWLMVDQAMIDAFAAVTRDWQFIHTDPDRAASSPFGGTIAHGFLTLSMLSHFLETAALPLPPLRHSVNYGCDRIRFVAPVPVGARIRGRFALIGAELRGEGQVLLRLRAEVEVQGSDRPALVADWLSLVAFAD